MQRHGYIEECYFDFTFTPVYGEDGNVDGIFNAVIETTYRIIGERRTGFLQKLTRRISSAITPAEVFKQTISLLSANPEDISFCYIYSLTATGEPLLSAATSSGSTVQGLPFRNF